MDVYGLIRLDFPRGSTGEWLLHDDLPQRLSRVLGELCKLPLMNLLYSEP